MAIVIAVPSVTLSNLIISMKWLTAVAAFAQRCVSYYCAHGSALDVADQLQSRRGTCGLFLHPTMIS